MNLILLLLFTYTTASIATISSHRSDFHRLNLPLYAYVMFYTIFFIPLAIFMHTFYQGYVFMYFGSDFITKISSYRIPLIILFIIFYYLLFFITIKTVEKSLLKGKMHTIILRIIFLFILTLFFLVLLYKRTFFIGSFQDYTQSMARPIYMSPAGFTIPFYIICLYVFEKVVIQKIKKLSI